MLDILFDVGSGRRVGGFRDERIWRYYKYRLEDCLYKVVVIRL